MVGFLDQSKPVIEDTVVLQEDLSPEDHHTREMYARYGLAMYQGNVLEAAVKNALLIAQVADGRFASSEEFQQAEGRQFRSVLGRLVDKLAPFIDDSSMREQLQLAIAIRNQFAHHFFWDHAADAVTWKGREAMMAESGRATELFMAVTESLEAALRTFAQRAGMDAALSADNLDDARNSLLRRGRVTDPERQCRRCGGALLELRKGTWRSARCVECEAVTLL